MTKVDVIHDERREVRRVAARLAAAQNADPGVQSVLLTVPSPGH